MQRSSGRGVMAGIVGGLVGSIALRGWMTAAGAARGLGVSPDQGGPAHQVAAATVRKVSGRKLGETGRAMGGELTHYLFGAVTGALYGAIAERYAWTTAGYGLVFGTGVFLAADESSMPALGLVPWPWQESAESQAEHLAAHLVFGVVTEMTRRAVRERF